jgi:U11/U12 small nuclear ribonucleoprotein SNRNP25
MVFSVGGEDVAMMNSATVKDLKLAIKKKVNDMEQSKMGHRHISWYIY